MHGRTGHGTAEARCACSGALRHGEASLLFGHHAQPLLCTQAFCLTGMEAPCDAGVNALLVVAAWLEARAADGEQRMPGSALVETIGNELRGQHQPVVADTVAQHIAHRRLAHRAPRFEDQAIGRLQAKVHRLHIGAEQDHVHARISLGELEGDAVHRTRHQLALGVEHHFSIAHAGQDLQEVLLQQETVVGADGAGDQQEAPVVAEIVCSAAALVFCGVPRPTA